MNLLIDNRLKNYVMLLAERAQEQSSIFPVDRNFLEHYLDEIRSFDPRSFIYCNLEIVNDTYVNQLFACLPEVWEEVNLDDILELSSQFTNVHSYFTLIKFTYKYIEIDIIENILSIAAERKASYLTEILEYLKNQYNVIVKSKGDLEDFEDGSIDVDHAEWMYIKQKFLVDKRIKPALLDFNEVKNYIELLIKNR